MKAITANPDRNKWWYRRTGLFPKRKTFDNVVEAAFMAGISFTCHDQGIDGPTIDDANQALKDWRARL